MCAFVKRRLSGVHMYKMSNRVNGQMAEYLYLEDQKCSLFTPISGFPVISRFSNLFYLGSSKCSGVIFRILDEDLTENYTSHRPNPNFFQFDLFLTDIGLGPKYAH